MDETHNSDIATAYAARDRIVRSITSRFAGADAEELVAEAYAQCCAADVTDSDHAVRWVSRAATHLAIDAKRGQSVATRYAPLLVTPESTESAEDRYLDGELHERVASAVAALPPYQREVLRAYAEGARSSEIAQRVGRSVYAVKHVIARSLRQLREQLADAELALIAFCGRCRRRTVPLAVSPAMVAMMPAAAIALSVVSPLAAHGAAFVLRMQRAGSVTVAYAVTNANEDVRSFAAIAGRASHGPAASGSGANLVVRASRKFEGHADGAVASLPRHPDVEATQAGRRVWVEPRNGAPSWAEYEQDPDDPVGDLTYCATHPVITLEQVYCEQPSR